MFSINLLEGLNIQPYVVHKGRFCFKRFPQQIPKLITYIR